MTGKRYYIVIILAQLLFSSSGYAQESIRIALMKDLKRADYYFDEKSFIDALEIYLVVKERGKGGDDIDLKIARTYANLNECDSSASWFAQYEASGKQLTIENQLVYAEVLSCAGDYDRAIDYYQNVHNSKSLDDPDLIMEKIWQLTNITYLYEDTSNYRVEPLSINTDKPEFGAVYFEDGIVYTSHKKNVGGIKNINGINNSPFFTTYFTRIEIDSSGSFIERKYVGKDEFASKISSKYHTGTVAFFPGQKEMVFARNMIEGEADGAGTLGLFFAEYIDEEWVRTSAYPYNSHDYSISNPAMNSEGTTLFFVSDMPGGYGGKDIYKSEKINGVWQEPINLGPIINTPQDEIFPFFHSDFKKLYFSSNGHSGLGGFDIFKVRFDKKRTGEVVNPGFPINSSYDDFGIVLNADGTLGYISSNRKNGGTDDDIFSLQIDRQSYPITIKGNLRMQKPYDPNSKELTILADARLELIDRENMEIVYTDQTDQLGRFRIEVPRSSQYLVRATDINGNVMDASFEVPKNMEVFDEYHIVMVQDLFNKLNNIAEGIK